MFVTTWKGSSNCAVMALSMSKIVSRSRIMALRSSKARNASA